MTQKVKWGVLGCADIAVRAFIPALLESQTSALRAVASRERAKGDSIAKKFGCDNAGDYLALLQRKDIDAVYVPLPNALHAEWIIAAAKAGKHVLCEKPLAMNQREASEVVAICKQQRVALMEGFAYQYHPQHAKMTEIVRSGTIGIPQLLEASFGFPPPRYSRYRFDKSLGGGALLDAGVYSIHVARRFFGAEPVEVFAALSSENEDVNMNGSILLNFAQGRTAQLSFGYNYSYRNYYAIWGSLGRVVIPNRAFSIPPSYHASVWVETEKGREEIVLPPSNCFLEEIRAFCEGLADPTKRCAWVQDILAQAAVVDRALQR